MARRLTTSRVREIIVRAHGVVYSASSIRNILRRLGYAFTRGEGWHRAERPSGRQNARLKAG
jgi:transposase